MVSEFWWYAPTLLAPSAPFLKSRNLTFAEREEIALECARGAGLRAIAVNGTSNFPRIGALKFPSLVFPVVSRIYRLAAPFVAFGGRPLRLKRGWRRDWSVCTHMFGDEIGMPTKPITSAFDLNDDSMVKKSVQECGRDNRIPEDLSPFREAAV